MAWLDGDGWVDIVTRIRLFLSGADEVVPVNWEHHVSETHGLTWGVFPNPMRSISPRWRQELVFGEHEERWDFSLQIFVR